jgi:FkbH-like protein
VKLTEALHIRQRAATIPSEFTVALVCGFTPLHLETFLGAHLQLSLPSRRVVVKTGLFGDLAGTLERIPDFGADAIAVAIEWPDLDPRLGYRNLGGWGPDQEIDMVKHAQSTLGRLRTAMERAASVPMAISLPSLPLPPAFHTPGWQASAAALEIQQALLCFAAETARRPIHRVLNGQYLDERSAPGEAFDLKTEILTGFPYTLAHADAMGEALARLIQPPVVKKGLITDLDDTLWNGLVGEEGPHGVNWDLNNHGGLHGVYQQLLGGLAAQGILLAVASKNDPAVADSALSRPDLLIRKDSIFPVEVGWHAKSESVKRILKIWNIGADDVVFVDDSPIELAEVKAVWPEIECRLFPKKDYSAANRLFRELRDLFGKSSVGAEDALRLESIRQSAKRAEDAAGSGVSADEFLAQADAVMEVQFDPPPDDSRVLELVNKTNQFNLNGLRHTEAEWRRGVETPGAFVMVVSYKDKFGALGKIAVLKGVAGDGEVDVSAWVMSCRAFSRRIEHRCLEILFDKFGAREIRFQFTPTPKNSPLREMFEQFLDAPPEGAFAIYRDRFADHLPALYHKMEYSHG